MLQRKTILLFLLGMVGSLSDRVFSQIQQQQYQSYSSEIRRMGVYYVPPNLNVNYVVNPLPSYGWESFAGRDDRVTDDTWRKYESFRMSYRWDVSSIHDSATIKSAKLEIWFDSKSDNTKSDSMRFFVRSISNTVWGGLNDTAHWNGLARGTVLARAGTPKNLDNMIMERNYTEGSNFCKAIKQGLAGNYFNLSVVAENDETWGTGMGTYHRISIYNGYMNQGEGVRLTITYELDSSKLKYNVTVRNSFNAGRLIVDNDTVNSGSTFNWTPSSSHTFKAFTQDSGGKHYPLKSTDM
jgi:hypothetical protein